jgi:hypothetical protein
MSQFFVAGGGGGGGGGGGFTWLDESSNFAASPGFGYFCFASLTATLPSTGLSNGSSVIFYADTSSAVTIQSSGGAIIQVGAMTSAANGIAVNNTQGAILELVYRVADNAWHAISSLGTWTVT